MPGEECIFCGEKYDFTWAPGSTWDNPEEVKCSKCNKIFPYYLFRAPQILTVKTIKFEE